VRGRRSIFALLILLAGLWVAHRSQAESRIGSPSVTIVATTSVEAHRAAIEGIRAGLAKSSMEIRVVDLSASRSDRSRADRFAAPGTRVIIALGSEALQLVAAERPEVPVISTMVLRKQAGSEPPTPSLAATIVLDVPVPVLLARLKQVFPGKTRLGIIRNPNSGGPTAAALEAHIQQLGFTFRVVDCPGAEQLLAALLTLKGRVDFVWCLPDGALYNSATIKPLILASIENHLPLIGFSESFARAGAALSAYPDFRDIGLQTGEAAQQIISGQTVHLSEGPRKLKLAVNQSVLRLLGLRCASAVTDAEDFSVLQ
jgi:putative ABC transport system substrate-binding protein